MIKVGEIIKNNDKNIDTNITCVRDEKFSEHLRISSFDDNLQKKFNENKDRVLNIMYNSKLDFGIEDFEVKQELLCS